MKMEISGKFLDLYKSSFFCWTSSIIDPPSENSVASSLLCSQLINMPQTDIDKLLQFLSICILVFLNEGSSSLSDAFMEEPWSWGLTIPISLYFKFALELHTHLGICVGVGIPSLIYWAVTRSSIDWYLDAVMDFNIEFLKTGLFNLLIGLAHWLILKLIHHFREWAKQNKKLSRWSGFLKLEGFSDHPLLRPIAGKQVLLQLLEMLSVFFYNGNIMLLSWSFSGQEYSSEIGKAISWVSLGSAMFVWMKACLKLLKEPPAAEEKAFKVAKDQSSIQSVGCKEQATCLSEC